MRVTIQSLHFDADSSLKSFIQEKLEKLTTFYANLQGIQVTLKLEKNQDKGNKQVTAKVLIPNHTLVANCQNSSFESCVDNVAEDLARQLKRHNKKEQDKQRARVAS